MKKLSALMYAFIAAALFLTSCGGDDETDPLSPTITVSTAAPTTAVSPSTEFTFSVDVRQGDAKLSYVTLREDGIELLASRVKVGGEQVTATDQYDVSSNSVLDFTVTSGTKTGTYDFTVGVFDKDGLSASIEFDIVVGYDSETGVVYSNLTSTAGVGSFYVAKTNTTYNTADAATNLADLDFAVNEPSTGTYKLVRPQDQATSNTTVTGSTTATTMFGTSSLTFASATAAEIEAVSPSATEIALTSGATYAFYNSATNTKGLVKVTNIDTATDAVTFDIRYVEVQAQQLQAASKAK